MYKSQTNQNLVNYENMIIDSIINSCKRTEEKYWKKDKKKISF